MHILPELPDPMPDTLPASERLYYQALHPQNYQLIVDLFAEEQNPFLDMRYCKAEEFKYYASESVHLQRGGASVNYLIFKKTDGQCVGILNAFGLRFHGFVFPVPAVSGCYIGYSIGRNFRRQGYACEAIQTLMHFLFENKHFDEIRLLVYQDNYPSLALAFKMGFDLRRLVVHRRKDLTYLLSISRQEFELNKAATATVTPKQSFEWRDSNWLDWKLISFDGIAGKAHLRQLADRGYEQDENLLQIIKNAQLAMSYGAGVGIIGLYKANVAAIIHLALPGRKYKNRFEECFIGGIVETHWLNDYRNVSYATELLAVLIKLLPQQLGQCRMISHSGPFDRFWQLALEKTGFVLRHKQRYKEFPGFELLTFESPILTAE